MAKIDTLNRCRAALEHLVAETGKVPGQTALARAAGVSPDTVARHWDALTGREDPALKPTQVIAAASRRCLSCRSLFASGWAGHRICNRCKRIDAWAAGKPEYSLMF